MYELKKIQKELRRENNKIKIYLYPQKIQKIIRNATKNTIDTKLINQIGDEINQNANALHSFYKITHKDKKLGELIFSNKHIHNSDLVIEGLEQIIQHYKTQPRIKICCYKDMTDIIMQRKKYPMTGYVLGTLH